MRLRELQERSSLVTVNRQLNPKIWDGDRLKPEVRAKLVEIARAFEEFVGIELEVTDYTVTGSNANYTWTDYSDLDLHLIIPGKATDEQRELFSAKKALWSEQHDITIKGLPVECYVQGSALLASIEHAMLSKDLDKLRAVKDKITQMRKAGLERAGEWSVENLVFKILRNLGLIDQITEKIRELEDQELSLEQQTNSLD